LGVQLLDVGDPTIADLVRGLDGTTAQHPVGGIHGATDLGRNGAETPGVARRCRCGRNGACPLATAGDLGFARHSNSSLSMCSASSNAPADRRAMSRNTHPMSRSVSRPVAPGVHGPLKLLRFYDGRGNGTEARTFFWTRGLSSTWPTWPHAGRTDQRGRRRE